MSQYSEIPCNTVRIINDKKYIVRKFGINNQVFEEELHPIPIEYIIKTFNDDGTVAKTEVVPSAKKVLN